MTKDLAHWEHARQKIVAFFQEMPTKPEGYAELLRVFDEKIAQLMVKH